MTKENLDQIIQEFPDSARAVVAELHDRILLAAANALEESQNSDKPAKVKIGMALTINLGHSPPAWNVSASVGVRYKAESEKVYSEN